MLNSVKRYHDFCMGHTVTGHEHKCGNLHGHNYRVHFVLVNVEGLDSLGRVIDFSMINSVLCQWIENNWDHKFMIWEMDKRVNKLVGIDSDLIIVKFNPTAENIARELLNIGNVLLHEMNVNLVEVQLDETRKCSATATF